MEWPGKFSCAEDKIVNTEEDYHVHLTRSTIIIMHISFDFAYFLLIVGFCSHFIFVSFLKYKSSNYVLPMYDCHAASQLASRASTDVQSLPVAQRSISSPVLVCSIWNCWRQKCAEFQQLNDDYFSHSQCITQRAIPPAPLNTKSSQRVTWYSC